MNNKQEVEKGTIDLVLCDTFGHLTENGELERFKDKEQRDRYIKEMQQHVTNLKDYLRDDVTVGSMLVGVDTFSMTSLGKSVFGDNAKRVLVWNKDLEVTNHVGYLPVRAYFMWGFNKRGWIYNLQEKEHFFNGEFLQSEKQGSYRTPFQVVQSMIRRFSNENSRVLELNPRKGSVIERVVCQEDREYIPGKFEGGQLYVRNK